MGTSINAILGGLFLVLALFLTFLMFHLWGYPFDKKTHKSSAPRSLMTLHRVLGYGFVGIYIFLMWDMVPRLWSYQVELPARTVLHLTLGIAVGALLLIKIAVVRFFKHLESTLAPFLGTGLLICTLMLTGLALPYTAREAYLRSTALDGANFSQERIDRVATFLPTVGFTDEVALRDLASSAGLTEGRRVLTGKCTQCHDLRTILVKPRTPDAWRSVVSRMTERSTTLSPISDSEGWRVTAYLIAISPTLQKGASDRRSESLVAATSRSAARQFTIAQPGTYDAELAEGLFQSKCSQCHSPSLVDQASLTGPDDTVALLTRMVDNGLSAMDSELSQIAAFLTKRTTAGGDQ